MFTGAGRRRSIEFLLAELWGKQSTLLMGIDKDTGSVYLYAVSHAPRRRTPGVTDARTYASDPRGIPRVASRSSWNWIHTVWHESISGASTQCR